MGCHFTVIFVICLTLSFVDRLQVYDRDENHWTSMIKFRRCKRISCITSQKYWKPQKASLSLKNDAPFRKYGLLPLPPDLSPRLMLKSGVVPKRHINNNNNYIESSDKKTEGGLRDRKNNGLLPRKRESRVLYSISLRGQFLFYYRSHRRMDAAVSPGIGAARREMLRSDSLWLRRRLLHLSIEVLADGGGWTGQKGCCARVGIGERQSFSPEFIFI